MDNPLFAFFFKGKKQQNVARIEVSPRRTVIREGEQLTFTAVAKDSKGDLLQGIEFRWTAESKLEKKSPVQVLPNGVFVPEFAGSFEVTA